MVICVAENELRSVLKKIIYTSGLALMLGLATGVHAQEIKIGFVSIERILRDSAPAKAAFSKLEQEFAKREKDLQELQNKLKAAAEKNTRDEPVLSDTDKAKRQREFADMDRELQRKRREFNEDVSQRKNEELNVIVEKANKVIKQIAETEKYDILFQEPVVFISPRVDITDKVLKALNK
jgi:outer membrane protein